MLVFSSHLAGISVQRARLLGQDTMGVGFASKFVQLAMGSGCSDLVHLEVWPRQGGFEAPFLKQVDIGFCAGSLVVLVGVDCDLLEVVKGSHGDDDGNDNG